jgi:bifunctional non-homologous end joining protein LigD
MEAVIDSEVVVLDAEGRSHFELLRHRQRREKDHLVYYVFDLLYLDGLDLRSFPLLHRKEILKDLIEKTSPAGIRFSDHVEEKGKALFEIASNKGLEGIVGKDAASPYVSGARTDYWVKFKNYRVEQVYIGGFTGSLNHIESLLLGVCKDKDFIYVGHTDKGVNRGNHKEELRRQSSNLACSSSPFKNKPDVTAPIHWVEPKLPCRVRFLDWTSDGLLRHASVMGLG